LSQFPNQAYKTSVKCQVSVVFEYTTKAKDSNSLGNLSYAMPPSALGAWVGMAASTRLGLTSGPPPSDTAMSSLVTFFQPLVVYVVFMLIFAIITAVGVSRTSPMRPLPTRRVGRSSFIFHSIDLTLSVT
jgi:hypothetical protein